MLGESRRLLSGLLLQGVSEARHDFHDLIFIPDGVGWA
jgi:hypothetical protein